MTRPSATTKVVHLSLPYELLNPNPNATTKEASSSSTLGPILESAVGLIDACVPPEEVRPKDTFGPRDTRDMLLYFMSLPCYSIYASNGFEI